MSWQTAVMDFCTPCVSLQRMWTADSGSQPPRHGWKILLASERCEPSWPLLRAQSSLGDSGVGWCCLGGEGSLHQASWEKRWRQPRGGHWTISAPVSQGRRKHRSDAEEKSVSQIWKLAGIPETCRISIQGGASLPGSEHCPVWETVRRAESEAPPRFTKSELHFFFQFPFSIPHALQELMQELNLFGFLKYFFLKK